MVFASRQLTLREDGIDTAVEIDVHAPAKTPDGAWSCRYTIGWPAEPREQEIFGFDGVQALVLALQMVGFDIYHSKYHAFGKLFWGQPSEGYGFPVHAEYRDVLIGNDSKYL